MITLKRLLHKASLPRFPLLLAVGSLAPWACAFLIPFSLALGTGGPSAACKCSACSPPSFLASSLLPQGSSAWLPAEAWTRTCLL